MQKVQITLLYLLVMMVTSCDSDGISAGNFTSDRLESLIAKNALYWSKERNEISRYDKARVLATEMGNGHCTNVPMNGYISLVLQMSLSTRFSTSEAKNIYQCLYKNNFEPSEHYIEMVGALGKWDKSDNVKLLYLTLFNEYVPSEVDIFGLIEFAMLRCNTSALNFLTMNNYPVNAKKILTDMEYTHFKLYVKNYCVTG